VTLIFHALRLNGPMGEATVSVAPLPYPPAVLRYRGGRHAAHCPATCFAGVDRDSCLPKSARAVRSSMESTVREVVAEMRVSCVTWQEIADILGVQLKAAQKEIRLRSHR